MFLTLRETTINPAKSANARTGNLLQRYADNGAAMIPPTAKPTIISQLISPSRSVNIAHWAIVTKNLARLTEPTVSLGLWPLTIRVDVITGPQPPPPTESTNPPIPPNKPIYRISEVFLNLDLIAFTIIMAPMIMR